MQPYKGFAPNPLVDGAHVTALAPSADRTSGSGAALIQPPKRTSRAIRLEINSMDRDYSKFPLATEFQWRLPYPVKEVREVRVLSGSVPVPYLNVTSVWNKFTFMDNYTNYLITLPVGFYTIATLCTALQTQLNSVGAFNTYTVGLNPATGVVEITAVGGADFAFLFLTGEYKDQLDPKTNAVLSINTPSRILGFGFADYYGTNGFLAAPRLPNLWYALERTYVYLDFDTSIDLRAVLRGSGRREPSCILYNDELMTYNLADQNFSTNPMPLTKYLNKETLDIVIFPAPASISRISALNLSLRDIFYNPIDTQGREMSLLLEMVVVD